MRSEPHITVTCDKCGQAEDYPLTELARRSWDARNLDAAMKRDGWRTLGDEDICESCIEDEIEDEEGDEE